MRKVKGFTILETEEEIRKHGGCSEHKFEDVPAEECMVCLNPNGEFVVGYGCTPVFVSASDTPDRERCVKCGYVRKKVED